MLDAAPDAVYVCVPPFAHGPIEETVAGAGAALFVEKPLGLDEAVAERVAGPAGDGPDRLGRRGGACCAPVLQTVFTVEQQPPSSLA